MWRGDLGRRVASWRVGLWGAAQWDAVQSGAVPWGAVPWGAVRSGAVQSDAAWRGADCPSSRQTQDWQTPLREARQQETSSCDESSMMGVPMARAELPRTKTGTNQPRSTAGEASVPGFDLGPVVIMVSVVVVMMVGRGKCWTCKHQQKQGGSNNLHHGENVAWRRRHWHQPIDRAPRKEPVPGLTVSKCKLLKNIGS